MPHVVRFCAPLRSGLCAAVGCDCQHPSKLWLKWNNHIVVPTVNIITQVTVAKMRRGLLLVTLFLLMKLRCSQSRCEETGSRSSTSDVGVFVRTDPNVCQLFLRKQLFDFLFMFPTDCRFGQCEAEHSEEIQRFRLWQLRGFDGQKERQWDFFFFNWFSTHHL